MVDFSAALARKYAILQQEANAKSMAAAASAYLDRTRANVLPDQAASENFERNARGRQTNVETGLLPDQAQAKLDLSKAQIGNLNSEAGFRDALTRKALGEQAPSAGLDELLRGQYGLPARRGQVTDRSAELGLPPISAPAVRSNTSMSASYAPRATEPRYSAPLRGPMMVEEVTGARSTGGMMSPRRATMPTTPLAPTPPRRPSSFSADTPSYSGPAPSMLGRFGGGLPPIGAGSALQFSAGLRPPTWLEQQGVGLNTSPSAPAGFGRSVDDYEREMAGRTSRPLLGLF